MLHTSIFYEILETDMVLFADSKYVIFNKNINVFLFFSYLSSVISPQLKKHTGSFFIHISFVSQPFKRKIVWCTKEYRPLHAIKKLVNTGIEPQG